MINGKKLKNDCIQWIRDWFAANGPECNAVIGISGGKDSTVVAGLLVEALGKDRVIGVMMPNGHQSDLDDAIKVCEHLGIKGTIVNIKDILDVFYNSLLYGYDFRSEGLKRVIPAPLSEQTKINLPPRLRMTTLYAISQSVNGRVANTCNLSEDWVGYSTRYGDSVGDFSPLSDLTTTPFDTYLAVYSLRDSVYVAVIILSATIFVSALSHLAKAYEYCIVLLFVGVDIGLSSLVIGSIADSNCSIY